MEGAGLKNLSDEPVAEVGLDEDERSDFSDADDAVLALVVVFKGPSLFRRRGVSSFEKRQRRCLYQRKHSG
ncbi:hypothetical protein IOCL2690_000246800 [Leishmania lindenbergi]|uniref:Uncharacterized protein n=1 Tax=Leishmania lindenbergi TaxID=651832 RepID=A0AAW3AQS6_9TRYP